MDLTPTGPNVELVVLSCVPGILLSQSTAGCFKSYLSEGASGMGVCEVRFLSNLNPSLLE